MWGDWNKSRYTKVIADHSKKREDDGVGDFKLWWKYCPCPIWINLYFFFVAHLGAIHYYVSTHNHACTSQFIHAFHCSAKPTVCSSHSINFRFKNSPRPQKMTENAIAELFAWAILNGHPGQLSNWAIATNFCIQWINKDKQCDDTIPKKEVIKVL